MEVFEFHPYQDVNLMRLALEPNKEKNVDLTRLLFHVRNFWVAYSRWLPVTGSNISKDSTLSSLPHYVG
ncbi:unnamed protein product [Sphenostylis stenocarpa]|uniref:Uncharacterized protein n=1 Tax=Sphenostylis stenocarpa TaxID=92480 RepID=A0AA86V7J9_9FABA|nr:unnamed protein product [Sphenostylis stenocarpa]